MVLNLVTLGLFIVNAFLLEGTWETGKAGLGTSITLSAIGCLLLLPIGYYGWEMISRDKVGVDMTSEQESIQRRYEREHKEPPLFH